MDNQWRALIPPLKYCKCDEGRLPHIYFVDQFNFKMKGKKRREGGHKAMGGGESHYKNKSVLHKSKGIHVCRYGREWAGLLGG